MSETDVHDIKDLRDALLRQTGNDEAQALEKACRLCVVWIARARAARGLGPWKSGEPVWPPGKSGDPTLYS